MAKQTVTGTFTATSNGAIASFTGDFNITIWGTFAATVALQRSFDEGATWHTLAKDSSGSAAAFSAPVSLISFEPENGIYYRLACTAYTSGTVNWRLSQ